MTPVGESLTVEGAPQDSPVPVSRRAQKATNWERVALIPIVALPWVAALTGRLPHDAATEVAAVAIVPMLFVLRPSFRGMRSGLLLAIAMVFWVVAIAFSVAAGPNTSNTWIETGHYLFWLLLVFCVVCARLPERAERFIVPLVVSTIGAMAFYLVSNKLGHTGLRNNGETLGFTNTPHEIALVSATLVACVPYLPKQGLLRPVALIFGVLAVLDTGVRTAAVALVVIALYYLIRSRYRARVLGVILLVGLVVLATGEEHVLASRFEISAASGEFSSFSTAGSGRGGLWTTAVDQLENENFREKIVGNGVYSTYNLEAINNPHGLAHPAQNDFLELSVDLGLLGLIGLILSYLALFRSRLVLPPLLVLLVYSVLNGGIDYSPVVVVVLLLALGLARQSVPARK
jgi:hypothetical protein